MTKFRSGLSTRETFNLAVPQRRVFSHAAIIRNGKNYIPMSVVGWLCTAVLVTSIARVGSGRDKSLHPIHNSYKRGGRGGGGGGGDGGPPPPLPLKS